MYSMLRLVRRVLPVLWIVGFACAWARGEMQFVGVLSGPTGDIFAVRSAPDRPAQWVAVGSSVGGFAVESYDVKTETLVLKQGTESLSLRLPTAKVQPLVRDEILAGMAKVLNLPTASSVRDLLHPRLQANYRDANLSAQVFEDVMRPDVTRGIRPLTAEESKLLDPMLRDIEKVVGERPTHAFWARRAHSFSLTFVVQSGESWYLAPAATPGVPDVVKEQPPPPPR